MSDALTPLPFATNVFMDPASIHDWPELHQTEFLEGVFAKLRAAMGPAFHDYVFYMFSALNARSMPASAAYAGANKILFFMSDESMSVPDHVRDDFLAIFKTHLAYELDDDRIFSLSLGFMRGLPRFPSLPVDERPIDVFFSGNLNVNRMPLYRELNPALRRLPPLTHPKLIAGLLRSPLRRAMRMDFSESSGDMTSEISFTRGFARGMSIAEYGRKLAASKIVLCPRGFISTETFRHIEALRAGAVVVSEPLPNMHLYRGSPIVEVADWRAGLVAVRALLADPARLADLQARGLAWYDDVLSEHGTAAAAARAIARAEEAARGAISPHTAHV